MGFRRLNFLSLLLVGAIVTWLLNGPSGCRDSPSTSPQIAKCEVTPDSIDFGMTLLQHQKLHEVTITNSGTIDLALHISQQSDYFGLVFIGTGTIVLSPGTTKRFTVTYAPQSAGVQSTVIDLGNEACTKILCKGEGYLDPLESCYLTRDTLDFGQVRVGDTGYLSFVIRNLGTFSMSGAVQEACNSFEITAGSGPFTLDKSESLEVTVRFQPTTTGVRDCAVSFGGAPCAAVSCRGVGIRGQTWLIKPDGSGDAPTIQAGIDSSFETDTVLVEQGIYNENIDFLGKNIVVQSQDGPDVTVLDGTSGKDSVVKFHNRETRAAMLIGFTITGGEGTRDFGSPSGGGIKILDGSPTIRGNKIVRNAVTTAPGNGGGIGVGHASMLFPRPNPLIEQNLIEANSTIGNGGGVSVFHADATIRNNIFRKNSTDGDGGGIWLLYYDGNAVISENEFWENRADDHGGGVYIGAAGSGTGITTIVKNLFVRNEAQGQGTGDTGAGGGIWTVSASGAITNNTLVGNRAHGESLCSGGGVLLDGTPMSLEFRANIIAFNDDCGLACKDNVTTSVGPNLFWQNTGGDLGTASGSCSGAWANSQIFVDPMFCNTAADNYTVASNSPALIGEQVMGAFMSPGCDSIGSLSKVLGPIPKTHH